jgi:hypothetical protein
MIARPVLSRQAGRPSEELAAGKATIVPARPSRAIVSIHSLFVPARDYSALPECHLTVRFPPAKKPALV